MVVMPLHRLHLLAAALGRVQLRESLEKQTATFTQVAEEAVVIVVPEQAREPMAAVVMAPLILLRQKLAAKILAAVVAVVQVIQWV
jgi:hypothetical protein